MGMQPVSQDLANCSTAAFNWDFGNTLEQGDLFMSSFPWYNKAITYIGLREIVGIKHAPLINEIILAHTYPAVVPVDNLAIPLMVLLNYQQVLLLDMYVLILSH